MKKKIEDIYPLSPMQQGMLFHTLYTPESQIYITQMGCRLEGVLRIAEFERAWQQVVDHHSILRTAFVWERRAEPLQIVYQDMQLSWHYEDWQELTPTQQQAQLTTFMESNQAHGFDLARPPLMRPALINLAKDTYYLILCHHHLLMDGWSLPLLLSEVFACYTANCRNSPLTLPSIRPYRDYIDWLSQQDLLKAESFWRNNLAGFTTPTQLSSGNDLHTHTEENPEVYKDASILLSSEISSGLKTLARTNELTLSILIQAAWALLLYHYTGEHDIVFGLATSGRPAHLPQVESMIGLFVNTLPHRIHVAAEMPLISWLHTIQDSLATILEYEYSPLVQVQGWSQVPRGMPLFESLFIFDNYPVNDAVQEQADDLKIHFINSVEHTNYPLTLRVRPGTEVYLGLSYASNRFSAETIERILGHLLNLLTAFIAQPNQQVHTQSILSQHERQQLLVGWNATETPYSSEESLVTLFEEQVRRKPEAIAVVYEEIELTYEQINAQVNQLAHYLKAQNVQEGMRVGIYIERSLDMLIAVLGTLKAGAAYVPLDPAYPLERLEFIMKDAQITLLVTQQSLAKSSLVAHTHVVLLDTYQALNQVSAFENPEAKPSSQHIAYVIYTSGSTGQPKGVQIPHTAVVNLLEAMQKRLRLQAEDAFLAVTSLSFDIAMLELFLPLLTGARLIIASQATTFDGEKLLEKLANCSATLMQATPATWRMLIGAGWPGQPNLKLLCGGEALSQELAIMLKTRAHTVVNLYGPTESTIWSATHVIDSIASTIPIGRPLDNTQIYILDAYLQPVSQGTQGDLYIGGKGLAYGYLERPALTADKFIPHPFSTIPGERLYKTGDIARYQPDGLIEFLGRGDHQIKLHGFRIELGEIENVLIQHPQIEQVVVTLREDIPGDQRLVGYIQPTGITPPSVSELRDYIKEKLPSYMLPAAFVFMDHFPLTPNNKINHRALPAPDNLRPVLIEEFVSARTPEEEVLTQIWKEILRIERIGINDNFFDLGGHSLLMIQLYTKIREHFKRDILLLDMFKYPTIASLAKFLTSENQAQEEAASTLEHANSRAQLRAQSMARHRQFREKQHNIKE